MSTLNQLSIQDNLNILITGATGSFGHAFVESLLNKHPNIKRLVIFSRDELKQYEMSLRFPHAKYPGIRYFLGDIRDYDRLLEAFQSIDIVIHAAALKQVPAAEYNPFEFIKTNVIGSENIIRAAKATSVSKVIALSTDKASSPVNLYGATKLCSDKLFIAANNIIGSSAKSFSVVRYGNVLGSRGSVIPLFLRQAKLGKLSITDPSMTRFSISLSDAVNMVLWSISNTTGGEIVVPKLPSYKIMDLAEAIAPNKEPNIIGLRPGEKIHEEMISCADSETTYDIGSYYLISPYETSITSIQAKFPSAIPVRRGFSYNSGDNTHFLSVEQIRSEISKHIDPNFHFV